MKLTILMPCLNESLTLPACISRAQQLLSEHNIDGEILISDNGSDDGSQALAESLGARVTHCPIRGYGAALQHGIANSYGEYVLMGDSDDSYHFNEAYPMVQKLDEGFDVCMGTRLQGEIKPGAMPLLNRYLGNPVLTFIGKLLFNINTTDFHCGMRAFKRDKVLSTNLVTTGMEWASEMVIKAKLCGLKMTEVKTTLHKDGRDRPPHLRRWRDSWRHLRFMLLHAPTWLFTYPGIALIVIASIMAGLLSFGPLKIGHANLNIHTMLCMFALTVVGTQVLFTGLIASVYGYVSGILPSNENTDKKLKRYSLEKLFWLSSTLFVVGLLFFSKVFFSWVCSGYPNLDITQTLRYFVPGVTMITVGLQGFFNGFMISMLYLNTGKPKDIRE